MFRLIREIKPQFVIGENVQGIINIQDGMVLRQVCDDLESEGFEVQCFLIPASGIGAWHQRYRVWIVGHSEHNGSLASKIERRNIETATRTQEGKNETSEPKRTSGSRDNEDVSDTTEIRSSTQSIRNIGSLGKESKTKERRKGNQSSVRTSSRSAEGREREEDVSNTDTRLSIGENEEVQTRRDTVDSGSSRGGEKNVSDTEIIGTREPRDTNQEKRNESSSSTQSNSSSKDVSNTFSTRSGREDSGNINEQRWITTQTERKSLQSEDRQTRSNDFEQSSKDVSNTDSGLRGGRRTIGQSGENKVWRFYSEEEEQTRVDIRSETIGRDALFGEGETDATNTNEQRTQVSTEGEYTGIEMSGSSSQKTWWQTQSDLCGVPNGISYELDKDRANRIKTLGNAIVPQIARELGLAIKKVVSEDII